jgi:L-alanine-DL-glutamate epimerase-like enolase superfamily enzyme
MKIVKVEAWPVNMKLSEPYAIAYEKVEHTTNVFLRIETSAGITGYGCGAPDEKITGETVASVINAYRDVVEPLVKNGDPLCYSLLLEKLRKPLKSQPSARAGFDMALYDILGKYCRLPLWKLLGGFRKNIKTSVTVGILPIEETLSRVREYIAKGFTAIKLKGGLDVDMDIERVNKVRETFDKHLELRFDANQGYTEKQALKFIRGSENAKIELLEQPTPKGQADLLSSITKKAPIPIMADESIMSLRDVFRLARGNVVDMVNIKLMKAGGIYEALMINAVARSAGLEVMVGCMDEATIAIAAGLHFALARPNVIYADLDGYMGLLDDPTSGAVHLRNGRLYPSDDPGLGFTIRDDVSRFVKC